MRLHAFLQTKPLYYDRIDLARMPAAYEEVRARLKLGTVVHLVGTNGKGTTGRMLAQMLRDYGKVGHYSSPHILRFNERIWIDGEEADDEVLEAAHRKLRKWLRPATAERLSYFEYTTLLALVAFESLDFVVLEAGLGGEFDATNVVPKELSVITPVGLDHQAFLGDRIEEITATKARSVDKKVLVAPQPDATAFETIRRVVEERGAELFCVGEVLPPKVRGDLEKLAREKQWPPFLQQNAATAAAACTLLTKEVAPVASLKTLRLPGRFERIAPNVLLDVGHNPLGAKALREALAGERRVLVYNALADKDAEEILRILAPVVKRLEILPIESDRAMPYEELANAAARAGLEVDPFRGLDETETYLVFGSFVVAEAFLKRIGRGR